MKMPAEAAGTTEKAERTTAGTGSLSRKMPDPEIKNTKPQDARTETAAMAERTATTIRRTTETTAEITEITNLPETGTADSPENTDSQAASRRISQETDSSPAAAEASGNQPLQETAETVETAETAVDQTTITAGITTGKMETAVTAATNSIL